jgi:hypothetical protein
VKKAGFHLFAGFWLLLSVMGRADGAELSFHHCVVDRVGSGYVMLSDTSPDPDFTRRWFKFPGNALQTMESVARRAFHRRLLVNVRVFRYRDRWMVYYIYIAQ